MTTFKHLKPFAVQVTAISFLISSAAFAGNQPLTESQNSIRVKAVTAAKATSAPVKMRSSITPVQITPIECCTNGSMLRVNDGTKDWLLSDAALSSRPFLLDPKTGVRTLLNINPQSYPEHTYTASSSVSPPDSNGKNNFIALLMNDFAAPTDDFSLPLAVPTNARVGIYSPNSKDPINSINLTLKHPNPNTHSGIEEKAKDVAVDSKGTVVVLGERWKMKDGVFTSTAPMNFFLQIYQEGKLVKSQTLNNIDSKKVRKNKIAFTRNDELIVYSTRALKGLNVSRFKINNVGSLKLVKHFIVTTLGGYSVTAAYSQDSDYLFVKSALNNTNINTVSLDGKVKASILDQPVGPISIVDGANVTIADKMGNLAILYLQHPSPPGDTPPEDWLLVRTKDDKIKTLALWSILPTKYTTEQFRADSIALTTIGSKQMLILSFIQSKPPVGQDHGNESVLVSLDWSDLLNG